MINFKEQEMIDSVRGALALRTQIEPLVDRIWGKGIRNLCFLGIGGTWQAACRWSATCKSVRRWKSSP